MLSRPFARPTSKSSSLRSLAGSSFKKNNGVQPLLTPCRLPSYARRGSAVRSSARQGRGRWPPPAGRPTEDDPFSALAFQDHGHHTSARVTYFRVYSGQSSRPGLASSRQHAGAPIGSGRILMMHTFQPPRWVPLRCRLGEIAAAVGINHVRTGDPVRGRTRRSSSR